MVHGVNTECIHSAKPLHQPGPSCPGQLDTSYPKYLIIWSGGAFKPSFGLVAWHLYPELEWGKECTIFTGHTFVIIKFWERCKFTLRIKFFVFFLIHKPHWNLTISEGLCIKNLPKHRVAQSCSPKMYNEWKFLLCCHLKHSSVLQCYYIV